MNNLECDTMIGCIIIAEFCKRAVTHSMVDIVIVV